MKTTWTHEGGYDRLTFELPGGASVVLEAHGGRLNPPDLIVVDGPDGQQKRSLDKGALQMLSDWLSANR